MNKNLENTIANLTSHFEKDDSHYSYVAKLTGSPYQGYTARILTIQRHAKKHICRKQQCYYVKSILQSC